MPAHDFFPRRGDLEVLDFMGDGFPFPLAISGHRLRAALDDQDPVAAAWRLRDAFECLIKLTSSLAITDFLRDSPASKTAEGVVRMLFRPMALGRLVHAPGQGPQAARPARPRRAARRERPAGRRAAGRLDLENDSAGYRNNGWSRPVASTAGGPGSTGFAVTPGGSR
jgi:hypothetical protein